MKDISNDSFVDDDTNKCEIVKLVDKIKYEQAVSECHKLKTLIKILIVRTIKVLSEQEYDHVRAEYKNILMLIKFQLVMMQLLMFGMNITLIIFLTQNAVDIITVFLQMMISTWLCQIIFLIFWKRTFRTTNGNIMWV